jgi:hypothetical protein
MADWRHDLSTLGLVIAAVLTAAGYAAAFTQPGAEMVFASWALAIVSAVLYPTWRRILWAAVIILFFFYYAGAALGLLLLIVEGARATRAFAR